MTYNKILENLYLGDIPDAINFDKEIPKGRIIVVLESRPPNEPFKAFHVPILSSSGHVHSLQLDQIACTIDSILQQKIDLLIHCAAGIERSPLMTAWYLHKFRNMTMNEAYTLIKEKRPQIADRQSWLIID